VTIEKQKGESRVAKRGEREANALGKEEAKKGIRQPQELRTAKGTQAFIGQKVGSHGEDRATREIAEIERKNTLILTNGGGSAPNWCT